MRHLIEALNFNVLDKAAGYIGVFEIVPGTGGDPALIFNTSNTAISFTLHIVLSVLQQSVKSLFRSELLETCLSF